MSGPQRDMRRPTTGYDFSMSSSVSTVGVVSFEEARRIVEEHATRVRAGVAAGAVDCDVQAGGAQVSGIAAGEVEVVDLLAGRGRVLAETVFADRDFPPFARATRDGYAVRAADVERVPARLEVIGEIRAGELGEGLAVGVGQAVLIMTGAPVPAGADAVAMVEYTREDADGKGRDEADRKGEENPHSNVAEDAPLEWGTLGSDAPGRGAHNSFVEILHGVGSGENFVAQGAEARVGQALVEVGARLNHSVIAIAAAVGKGRVQVFRKPRVAVLSTGDEVVEIGVAPEPAQIRNSNSYSLAAQIEEAGGEAVRLAISPDEPRRLRELMEEGFRCDLLLMTGGVSMGKYDLVEQVLGELGAEFYFTGARIQPGKPVVFGACVAGSSNSHPNAAKDAALGWGTRAGQGSARKRVSAPHYFFGLPGNPVSTMVTFRLFAEPMIAALGGARPEPLVFFRARLKKEVRTKTGLTRFLPAIISGEFEDSEVELAAWQGSGDIAALARANCYVVIPPDRERIAAGESVAVMK